MGASHRRIILHKDQADHEHLLPYSILKGCTEQHSTQLTEKKKEKKKIDCRKICLAKREVDIREMNKK